MTRLHRIVHDPNICHGKACFRGTRILVSVVLDNLAARIPEGEILRNYPTLHQEDIEAALEYAALLSKEKYSPVPARVQSGNRRPAAAS
jgi:uncharacterized protein (DUF433 family)